MATDHSSRVEPVREIQFRLLSSDEIRKKSVMACDSTLSFNGTTPQSDGLMSLKMGADALHPCATCHQNIRLCPGHPGHISLAKPVFNVIFFDHVVKVLRCVCFRCSRLLFHPDHPEMVAIMRLEGQRRFEALVKLVSKSSAARLRCGASNPHGCGASQPIRVNKQFMNERFMRVSMELAFEGVEGGGDTADTADAASAGAGTGTGTEKLSLTAEDALAILRRVSDDDVAAMGMSPMMSRPENMIVETLLVPPPCVRPCFQTALLQRSENDLTIVLGNVIKANNALKTRIAANKTVEPNDLYLGLLQYHVATLMDNESNGLAPATQRTGRPIVSIAQRIKTKEGRVRGNLLGKRVDSSARCVITPDPYISIDELGVPLKVAMNITFPETVREDNVERLREAVRNGPNAYPGAKFVELRRGDRTVSLADDRAPPAISAGDIVQRHVLDGDYMLFNRQPTLHRMSMMAHRARVMPGNTFRLNPLACNPYNADFDGDEINAHACRSAHSMAEISCLAAVPIQMISPRTSAPIMTLVQDVALGVYEISQPETVIDPALFANLMCGLPRFSGTVPHMESHAGHTALSAALSPLVNSSKKNTMFNSDDPTDPANDRNVVRVRHGQLTGVCDKDTFGGGTTGLIHHTYNEMGPRATTDLLDATQRLVCDWFKHRGFSVGLRDVVLSEEARRGVDEVLRSTKQKVYDVIADVHTGTFQNASLLSRADAFEKKVSELLNRAREEAQKIGKRHIEPGNRMMSMINSKSKGSSLNVVQMIATLGQQTAEGKRPAYGFDSRTLPHYYKYDDGPEARGFVESSFVAGLSPAEFFFHSIGGREGLTDTAVKSVTAETEIVVVERGATRVVAIGPWVDAHLSARASAVRRFPADRDLEILDLSHEVTMPTADYEGRVSWAAVTAVTRHDPGEVLYRIETRSGRAVTVTAGKSLLVWQPALGAFREVDTPDLRAGDRLPLTAALPAPPADAQRAFAGDASSALMVGMALAEHGGPLAPCALTAPTECVRALLHGFFSARAEHDAATGLHVRGLDPATARDVAMLCTRVGAAAYVREEGRALHVCRAHAERLARELALGPDLRVHALASAAASSMLHNDVELDEVVAISEVAPAAGQKMYDLTVPSTLNFGLANGLQVRDTSESGYIQRKLIKAMEDCKIATDHTVRNAAGNIVQFQYGEDGMDSCSIEEQRLFHVGFDLDKLASEFLVSATDELAAFLSEEALAAFAAGGEATGALFDAHVRDIARERNALVAGVFENRLVTTVSYPVAFERILENALARQSLEEDAGAGGRVRSDLDPAHALRALNATLETLAVTDAAGPCLVLRALMRTHLAPKRLMRRGASRATFEAVLATVAERFAESVAHPGEMVGILAAQSIGEPTTQLTLNSVAADTEVLVDAGAGPAVRRIAEVVDALLPPVADAATQNDVAAVAPGALRCLALSSREQARWSRVTHVSRHPSHDRVITVTTRSGRRVQATEGHSFLVRRGNRAVRAPGSSLAVGDAMPVLRSVPAPEGGEGGFAQEPPVPALQETGRLCGAVAARGALVRDAGGALTGAVLFREADRKWAAAVAGGYNRALALAARAPGLAARAQLLPADDHGRSVARLVHPAFARWMSAELGVDDPSSAAAVRAPDEFARGYLQALFDCRAVFGCLDGARGDPAPTALRLQAASRAQAQAAAFLLARLGVASHLAGAATVAVPAHALARFLKEVGTLLPARRRELGRIAARRHAAPAVPGVRELMQRVLETALPPDEADRARLRELAAADSAPAGALQALLVRAVAWGAPADVLAELEQAATADCFWDEIAAIEKAPARGQMVYDFTVADDTQTFVLANLLAVHNTFHSAGVESESRAVRGLPRVKELLSVSRNTKQPILTAVLVPGLRETVDDAARAKNELETTVLSQVVARSSVYFDPEKFATSVPGDQAILDAYRLFQRADAQTEVPDASPWVVRLELSKPDLLEHGVTMFDVAEAVNDFYRDTVCCMFSDDNARELVFRVRLTGVVASGTSADVLTDVRAFELAMLESVVIKGGFGVQRAIPMKRRCAGRQRFDAALGAFRECAEGGDEWVLETDGRDLGEILAHPMVVFAETVSNEITEVLRVLGVEAARAALLFELGEVMKVAYANPRHFLMLADVMCAKGTLTSVDRHGLNRGDATGPLTKASFEETIDILRNAGIFAEVDKVDSVAAAIMLGKVVDGGTGATKLKLDEALVAGLPEHRDDPARRDDVADVSRDDVCRDVLKFAFAEPAHSDTPVDRIPAPVIVFV